MIINIKTCRQLIHYGIYVALLIAHLSVISESCRDNNGKSLGGSKMGHLPGQMKIYDALKIAIESLEKNRMMYREAYKLTASRADDQWVFWFVFLPETPGLDVSVFVSDDGNVKFLPGI